MSDAILAIENLSVEFGTGEETVRAVDDVTLSIGRGQIFGIAGESGSGKTTLLYALARILPAGARLCDGRVTYTPLDGPAVDVLSLGRDALRRLRWAKIAIVTQAAMNALNPVVPIETQLTDALAAHGITLDRRARSERASELLGLVGISRDRLRAFPHELSGGTRQRVMIAMALALQPEVLILDEPTTALDVVTQRQIIQEVYAIQERFGMSVIFVTHDLALLLEIADRIAVMYAGKIVEVAANSELLANPAHPYSDALLASFPTLYGGKQSLKRLAGSPPNMRDLPHGCSFQARCTFAEQACYDAPPRLNPTSGTDGELRLVACHLYDPTVSMKHEPLAGPGAKGRDR